MSENTVYLKRYDGSNRTVYHTNEDCPVVKRTKIVREITIPQAESRNLRECEHCSSSGGVERSERDMSYQKALKAAATRD